MNLKKIFLSLVVLGAVTQVQAQQSPATKPPLQQRVGILERQVRALTDMVFRLDTLTREMQQLRGEVELQNHSMDALKERQRDLYLDLDKRITTLNSKAAAAAIGRTNFSSPSQQGFRTTGSGNNSSGKSISTIGSPQQPTPVTPGDPSLEDERYRAAFGLLREGKYAEAGNALRSFLVQYPDSDKADNAQYWLAEAAYTTKDLSAALANFSALIQNYPQSTKVSDAMLKSGYIYYDSQQFAPARDILQKVIKEYAGSTPAKLARKQLDRMDREGR